MTTPTTTFITGPQYIQGGAPIVSMRRNRIESLIVGSYYTSDDAGLYWYATVSALGASGTTVRVAVFGPALNDPESVTAQADQYVTTDPDGLLS